MIIDHSDINQDSGPFINGAIEFVSHLSADPYPFTLSSNAPTVTPLQESTRICEGALRRYEAAQRALASLSLWADKLTAYIVYRAAKALQCHQSFGDDVQAQYDALADRVNGRVLLAKMIVSMEFSDLMQAQRTLETLVAEGGQ